jgi:hypothetical protein
MGSYRSGRPTRGYNNGNVLLYVLPEDGPVMPKYVARNRIYIFNYILRTF